MSELDAVKQSVEDARNEVTQAKLACEQAQNTAADKMNEFAGLGLEGVAQVLNAASDSLSSGVAQLGVAFSTGEEAVNTLSGLSDQTAMSQTVQALDAATAKLGTADTEVQGAAANADEAFTHAQQSEVEPVVAAVAHAISTISQARSVNETTKAKLTEHRHKIDQAGKGLLVAASRSASSATHEPIAKIGDPVQPPQDGPDDTSAHRAELKSADDDDKSMSKTHKFGRAFSRGAQNLSKANKEQVEAAEATARSYESLPPQGETQTVVGVPAKPEISASGGDSHSMADPLGTLVLCTAAGLRGAGIIRDKMRRSRRG